MARGAWIYDKETGKLVPKWEFLAKKAQETRRSRSSLSTPMVIGSMDPIRSVIDGKMYDSKSAYYRHVERNGCAIVGHDKNWTDYVAKPPLADEKQHEADIVADVKKAIEQVSSL
ncbi:MULTISPECIES: hypothetical protein [Rhodomicrobium]|uniref:hypothetical protein n=1 Tax=Rhodomicrobium TaxID=1068 RepID=UPI000F74423D|nr:MULTISPECIES: hypothetical protein [Rhodomicrobium]